MFCAKQCRMAPRLLTAVLFLCLCGVLAAGGKAAAQGTARNPAPVRYGDWQKNCTTPPGTPNMICELTQTARAKDRPDISFRISFIKLPQKKGVLLRVIVPIRVELPMGVGVNIDGAKDMGNMLYRRCFGDSCLAEAVLTEKDMQNFFAARAVSFFIFPTPEEGVGGTVSLNGVKAGYDSLP
ncbi:invasion associated locus B family protein [Candidatus Tokpelaia sp.]|uniref:invasion associated locus B family protein n=1 Tax=Candidatus Tokpelaia sp. TaxID=2233777 RepID=UPI001FF06BA9|nr:invasion associated locus B family protein [Candidatus Tokpelaia sp.]